MRISIIVTMAAALTSVADLNGAGRGEYRSCACPFRSSLRLLESTPMTRSERFRNYLTATFGPNSLARSMARAGLDQLRDSPAEWGQGSAAFGERLGNVYAKHIIRGGRWNSAVPASCIRTIDTSDRARPASGAARSTPSPAPFWPGATMASAHLRTRVSVALPARPLSRAPGSRPARPIPATPPAISDSSWRRTSAPTSSSGSGPA